MKFSLALRLSMFSGLAALCTPALSCSPPPPPTPESLASEQKRVDDFKAHARASDIVFGVLESSVGYDDQGKPDLDRIGVLRVVHVYQGTYAIGQRVKVRPGGWPLVHCPTPPMMIPRGVSGVVILEKSVDGKPVRHDGFLPDHILKMFFDEGIIRSARVPPADARSSD